MRGYQEVLRCTFSDCIVLQKCTCSSCSLLHQSMNRLHAIYVLNYYTWFCSGVLEWLCNLYSSWQVQATYLLYILCESQQICYQDIQNASLGFWQTFILSNTGLLEWCQKWNSNETWCTIKLDCFQKEDFYSAVEGLDTLHSSHIIIE